ncbi:helix-turn-helix domain-containing protein [bacterium CPR1]|nr:helix-turn-helix domain-containing protein [bacterium CPR1]
MLSASQAASRLGISRSTLLRWFREGRISHVGRDFRGWRTFAEEDLVRIQRELGEVVVQAEPPEERRSRARMRAYLRRVPAFRHMSEAVIDELARCARFLGLLGGQRLFGPGDRTQGLLILVKGRVRISRVAHDGREQVLAVATPYQTLGETVLFNPDERHGSYATCLESSTVMVLPLTRVRQLTRQHSELALSFLAAFSQRIQGLEDRVEELAFLNLDQRLARTLLEWARERGQESPRGIVLELGMSTAELASLLGGARESVSRALIRLAKDGMLERHGQTLTLLDPEALGKV